MKNRTSTKYPKGCEILARYVKLDSCIMYVWSSGTIWRELPTPHTVYLRKCADRTGYVVYDGVLWDVEMRDEGGAYMVSKADLSMLAKVS